MAVVHLASIHRSVLDDPAGALAQATREAASVSPLAEPQMIPQAALGLALQASVRQAVQLGGVGLDDVLGAFSVALAWVICSNAATPSSRDALGLKATRALRAAIDGAATRQGEIH